MRWRERIPRRPLKLIAGRPEDGAGPYTTSAVLDGGIVVGFDGFAFVISDLDAGDDRAFAEALGDQRSLAARASLNYLLASDCCGVVRGLAGCSF